MIAANFVVVLDACVLFPFTLRDTLLRSAESELYQLRWSAEILDEMERNLVSHRKMQVEQALRLRRAMEEAFPDAEITGYQHLTPAMQNDKKDRHVVAAAVMAGAQVITTHNLKDFRSLPDGIEAQSPDEFLCNIFDLNPAVVVELLRQQAADLSRPQVPFHVLLGRLQSSAPEFVGLVRGELLD